MRPHTRRNLGRNVCRAVCATGIAVLALVIAAATPAATVDFAPVVNFDAVGRFSDTVAVGDVNRDGRPDILSASNDSFGTPSVSVFLGDGAGGFGAATGFPAGSTERGFVIADFNGDAKPDVAVTNRLVSGTVSVLLGNGSGGFGAATTFAVGNRPTEIAVGDLNDDGRPDLVVANQSSTFYSVLLGSGTGSFGAATSYVVTAACATASPPVDVQLGDVNADGKLDLVGSTDCGAIVGLGDGTGAFGTPTLWSAAGVNGFGFSIAIGDLNDDGNLDFVAGEDHFTTVNEYYLNVMLGTGTGSFAAAGGSPIQVSFSQGGIAIADLNGDDVPDVAIGDAESGAPPIWVLPGNGDGSFGAAVGPFAVGTGNPAEGAGSIAVGDLDGDAKPDLVVGAGNQSPSRVSVLFNAAAFDESFAPPVPNTAGNAPAAIAIDDLDGDGKPDLVTADADDDTVSVLLNSTSTDPTFSSTAAASTSPRRVATGDFNKDGKVDKAILNSGDLTVRLGDGQGGELSSSTHTLGAGTLGISLQVLDYDRDGKQDVVAVSDGGPGPLSPTAGSGTLSLFKGNGAGEFAARVDHATGATPTEVASGDFDRDGRLDLAVSRSDPNGLRLLKGDGTGGFGTPTDFAAGGAASSVAAGNVDGDGKPDLAVTNDALGKVSVMRGNGSFGFSSTTPLTVGTNPRSVAIGDIDGDKKLDLAVANAGSNDVSTLKGVGDGTFQSAVSRPTLGSSPNVVVIGDTDGDLKRDLVTANTGSNDLSIMRGDGSGGFGAAIRPSVGTAPVHVAFGDLNKDGRKDLLTANDGSSNVSQLLNQLRQPTMAARLPLNVATLGRPVGVATGDLNGDGRPDIVTANKDTSNVSVMLGTASPADGPLGFGGHVEFPTGASPRGVAVGDVNGDNKKDVVVARADIDGVAVLLGDGSGNLDLPAPFAGGGAADSIAVRDVTGDSSPDVAITNAAQNQVTVLVNAGTPGSLGFSATNSFSVQNNPLSVALGDLDEDGRADLAVGNRDSDSVTVLRGHNDGNFDTPSTLALPPGSLPSSLSIRDQNGDRKPDVVVASKGTNSVRVFLQRRTGGFAVPPAGPNMGNLRTSADQVIVGDAPTGVATDDLNLDGIPDVATSNETSGDTSSVPNVTLVDTETTLGSSTSTPTTGTPITYTATVSLAPLGGTVSFSDNGSPISGCDDVAVNTTTGEATCVMTYTDPTVVTLRAAFSGYGFSAPSTSSPLIQLVASPTAVLVRSFSARWARGGVQLRWRTAQEVGLLGFDVYRSTGAGATKLNRALIRSSARGSARGATYAWLDRSAPARERLVYRLRAASADGTSRWLRSVVVRR